MSQSLTTARLERNGPYWRAVYTDAAGRKIRRGIGRGTRGQANATLLSLSPSQRASRMPLASWAEQYLASREADLAEATFGGHRQALKLLKAFAGPVAVREVTPAMAGAFIASLPGELNTRRKVTRYCKSIFAFAVRSGVSGANPFSPWPGAHVATDRRQVYVPIEGALEAGKRQGDRWPLLLALTRQVGLRLGEAQRVRGPDVDLKEKILTVEHQGPHTTKRRRRKVPLSDRAIMALVGPWLFEDSRLTAGTAWPHRQLRRLTGSAWTFQDCRASCETDWLHDGNVLADVAAWMGHSPIVALKHYHQASMTLKEQA
jgi:integrase